MCLIYSQPIDYGWEWIIDIGIENNTNYYIDSISVGYIVSFTDTTTISKSDTLNIMIYSFGHSSVIPPKTNIVYTTWNHSDCKYPPEDYQENASEYIESINPDSDLKNPNFIFNPSIVSAAVIVLGNKWIES